MTKEAARALLNRAKEGKPTPVHQIREALFVLGDMTYRKAPRPT